MMIDWKKKEADYFLKEAAREENQWYFARIAGRLLELGHPEKAATLCEKNIGRAANYLSGLVILGQSYLALGEYDKAREVLNSTLKQDPDNLRALYLLAQTAQGTGDILLALSFYERVMEADPFCEEASAEADKLRRELEARDVAPTREVAPAVVQELKEVVKAAVEEIAAKPSAPAHKEPERVKPARKEQGEEFLMVKEVGVETPMVGDDTDKVRVRTADTVLHDSSISPRDLEAPPPAPPPSPVIPEPAPVPEAAPTPAKPLFETASIAEIYAKQGLFELALRVYQKLLNTDPGEALYKTKIAELEEKIREQRAG